MGNPLYPGASIGSLWTPRDHSLLAATGDPAKASGTGILVSGTLQVVKLGIPAGLSVSNVVMHVTTAGATLTGNQQLIGLYSIAGVRLGRTADGVLDTPWTSTGQKVTALSAPVTVGQLGVFVVLLSVGTTPPTFAAEPVSTASIVNTNQSATAVFETAFRAAVSSAGQTSLPATIDPTAFTSSGKALFVGLS